MRLFSKFFVIFAILFASALAWSKSASIGPVYGVGSYSPNAWPMISYGGTVSLRGDRQTEIALDYLLNQVSAPGGYLFLQQYELDLRHRFGEKFGLYIGLPIIYFGSSNENISPSGVNIGGQLGYDFGITNQLSVGIHGQATVVRNYYVALMTLKLWSR